MEKVERVMGEFKRGALHSGSKRGPVVKDRQQAVAIGLSEARKAGEHVKPRRYAQGGIVAADQPIVEALKRGLAQRMAMRQPFARPGVSMGMAGRTMVPGRPMMQGRPMAKGGAVPGRGTGDSVPAKLTPGEFVVRKAATKRNLPLLKRLNAGKKASPRADRIKEFEDKHGGQEI